MSLISSLLYMQTARSAAFALVLLTTATFVDVAHGDLPAETYLFQSGKGGYPRYRIPVLLTAPDKSLLAFCEGRKDGGGLTGNIDLVRRRSSDGGKTWKPIELVMDDGENTLGNPCPVMRQDDEDDLARVYSQPGCRYRTRHR